MKRIEIILFLVVLFSLPLSAQRFGGGIYAGLSASQIHGDGLGGYDLPGINAGVYTAARFWDRAALQMEIAFIQKGAREKNSDSSRFYKARLNYIEIPLLFQYYWGDFALEIGPALDILVSAREEQQGFTYRSNPPYRKLNLSAIAGINWYFSEKTYISLRTNNSLTPIREGNAVGNSPQSFGFGGYGQRNIVLSFALVWQFKEAQRL